MIRRIILVSVADAKFAVRLSSMMTQTLTINAISTICKTFPSTNGSNKLLGTAPSNMEMICPAKTLLLPSIEITGKKQHA